MNEHTRHSTENGDTTHMSTDDESDTNEAETTIAATHSITSEGRKLENIFLCPLPDCPTSEIFTHLDPITHHLRNQHCITISDIEATLPFFTSYISSLVSRLSSSPPLVSTGSKNSHNQTIRIVGAPSDKVDSEIRAKLQQEKLNQVLQVQHDERENTNWRRKCLFCRLVFDARSTYLGHMWEEHGFNIGCQDNIVWFDEYLDVLQRKLTNLQCLYCERVYRDQSTLRSHMRKKKHFKLKKSEEYDKYYVINYTDKKWGQADVGHGADEEDESWDDWNEPSESNSTMCLFCEAVEESLDLICAHMVVKHTVDLYELRKRLDVYQYISLINYLRKQFISHRCFSCLKPFNNLCDLITHLDTSKHEIPEPGQHELYNDLQHLFPTVEGDTLLMLDLGDDATDEVSSDVTVVAEPIGGDTAPDLRKLSVDERIEWLSRRS